MSTQALIPGARSVTSLTEAAIVPALIESAGSKWKKRFVEFLTAEHRNPNTRKAYAIALDRFLSWCEAQGVKDILQLEPVLIAAYIEQGCPEVRSERLTNPRNPAKKTLSDAACKQHLASIRKCFDYLITGGLLEMNPASAVNGPKLVIEKGKTPVLSAQEAADLIDAINVRTIAGLRDRALIALMLYTFTRIGAAVRMNTEDIFVNDYRRHIRRSEKGGRYETIPLHHLADQFLMAYAEAAGILDAKGTPLFRTLDRRRQLTETRLDGNDALRMIKRRARAVNLNPEMCNHSLRGTGITEYVRNGGSVENARVLAGHASSRTTNMYIRVLDDVKQEEVERISIPLKSV